MCVGFERLNFVFNFKSTLFIYSANCCPVRVTNIEIEIHYMQALITKEGGGFFYNRLGSRTNATGTIINILSCVHSAINGTCQEFSEG